MSLSKGTKIGERYELVSLLGEGAMGRVHCARDSLDGALVAIKTIKAEAPFDEEAYARFSDEATVCAQLNHDGVVRLRAFDLAHRPPYLVFDLVDGTSFRELLKKPIDARKGLQLLTDVSRTFVYVHSRGVIHRDLKPENILVTKDCRALVSDFGLAKAAEVSSVKTKTGLIVGTLVYMAPERFLEKPATAACDVYAIGVMLYEVLAKRPPFQSENPVEVARGHIKQEPPSLKGQAKDCPQELIDLVTKCLQKEPAGRPTMSELLQTLSGVDLSREGGKGRLTGSGKSELKTTLVSNNESQRQNGRQGFSQSQRQKANQGQSQGQSQSQSLSQSLTQSSHHSNRSRFRLSMIFLLFSAVAVVLIWSYLKRTALQNGKNGHYGQDEQRRRNLILPKIVDGPFFRGGMGWIEAWCELDKAARVTFLLEDAPKNEDWPTRKEVEGKIPRAVFRSNDFKRLEPAMFTVALIYRGLLLGRMRAMDRQRRLIYFCGKARAPSTVPFFHKGGMYMGEWSRVLHAVDLAAPKKSSIVGTSNLMDETSQKRLGCVVSGFIDRDGELFAIFMSPYLHLMKLPPFATLEKGGVNAWTSSEMTEDDLIAAFRDRQIPKYATDGNLDLFRTNSGYSQDMVAIKGLNNCSYTWLIDEEAFYVSGGSSKGKEFVKVGFDGKIVASFKLPNAMRYKLSWVEKDIVILCEHAAVGDAECTVLVLSSTELAVKYSVSFNLGKVGTRAFVKDKHFFTIGKDQIIRIDPSEGKMMTVECKDVKACPQFVNESLWAMSYHHRGRISKKYPVLLEYDYDLKKVSEHHVKSVFTVESVGNGHVIGCFDRAIVCIFSDRLFAFDMDTKEARWSIRLPYSTCFIEPVLHEGTLYIADKRGILSMPLVPENSSAEPIAPSLQ